FVTLLVIAIAPAAEAAPGDLDTSFDGDGVAEADFGVGVIAQELAIDGSDRIVVAGTVYDATHDFGLSRFLSDGSLDTGFGTNGFTQTDFGGMDDDAFDVTLGPAGKIVAAGMSVDTVSRDELFSVARYRRGGLPDTTFDADGQVQTDFGSGLNIASAVVVQANGKIV